MSSEFAGVVNKGGVTYFEMAFDRTTEGIEVWVKVDPVVENTIANLASGRAPLNGHTENWKNAKPGQNLELYEIEDRFQSSYEYQISNSVGYPLIDGKGRPNISFLRFVGTGSGEGVRFVILGPFSRGWLRSTGSMLVSAVRSFIRDYIAPVHIDLRITSTEG